MCNTSVSFVVTSIVFVLCNNIDLKYHFQVGRYQLDFYNDELKKYVEIDGEQHYSDYMINHDKERDNYLLKLGWEGLRIRWSEYQKMTDIEKQNKIIEIKLFLQNKKYTPDKFRLIITH